MSVTQTEFRAALLDAAQPVPEGLEDGQGRPAGRRFSVYRNNVAVSLTDALMASFPTIVKLIGDDNFKKVAGLFLRRHPPATPMIMYYGDAFPGFLDGFEPLRKYGYLPDVARLEQAQREAYHAGDADPADPSVLQSLPPEELADVRFAFAPAVRIVRSDWPIHAIWAFNMADGPKPQPGPQTVLITRPEYDPVLTPIGAGTETFVTALMKGATLGKASEAADEADDDFDLSGALGLLLSGQAITRITTRDDPE